MFQSILNISPIIFAIVGLVLADWLEKSGTFQKWFHRKMQYWHFIVVIILFEILADLLPPTLAVVLSVAVVALYIGYKIGKSK